MCGRFTIAKSKTETNRFLSEAFNLGNLHDFNLPRYNIGPSQDLISLIFDGENYRLGHIAWDYRVKHKDRLKVMINARGETVDQLYAFKKSFLNRRCLILADGFYEWDKDTKQAYRIIKKDGSLHFYAGIYQSYIKQGVKHFGALIITTSANDLIQPHHDRMPVILDSDQAHAYLDPHIGVQTLKELLKPYPSDLMAVYPVSRDVNHMIFDNKTLIEKI